MTVYELWLGEQPFKEIKAIMRERHIQNNDVDFPVDMPDDCKTLIRGLLNYTPKDRMGNEHVQKWLKGETLTLNNKPVTVTGTVYEPLKIGNETASNPKEMSALMGKYPDMGKVCLYDDFITSNLKKAGDVTLYNEIKNVISQYGNDREAGLTAAMYTLDPERPFISRTGKPCTSGEEIADAITADSAHYMDDLKNPNAGLYIYITVTGGSQGKEVADIFRKYFKEYSPNRALTLVFLKLQSDGGMSIGSKRYLSADELAQENDSSQINLIIKAVCEKDSQLLVWLSDIYGDYFKSTEEFAKLSTPDQFFLLGLLPFLSFKELTGSNGEDALHDLIYNYLERADFFETYAGQGLPLKGQILDSPVKKTPIDYVVRNFNYLSGTYGSDTVCNLIRLLHKLAADVNEYSGDDTNPLINANLAKEKDLVNLLLELGADPNPYRKFIERQEEQERIERERIEEQDKYKTCIFASFDFTVALKTDGTVVAVGNNREGQCKTSGWRDIVAISVAENVHTVGLKADGTVVAVGYNKDGRCNTGGWRDIVAVSAGGNSTVGLKADGTVVVVGSNGSGQCNTGGWCDIVTVFAGGGVTVGLKADGTVVAVGSNEYGLCNVISGWRDIVAVSIGSYSSIVGLKADGTVVADGRNEYGECDTGGWRNIVAIFVTYHTVGLKADGTVVAVGNNREGQCKTGGWRDIVAISAGCSHTVGLKADGTVVAVGYNKDGQCNTSDWRDIIAVSAGDFHTVGLKADGTVVAVGVNYDGRCNTGDWRDIGPASKERQIRMKQGLCIHCGGQLGGLFTKKCKICGKVKP
jgi:alpha-tubulin suppressor-like RCC1 family protein